VPLNDPIVYQVQQLLTLNKIAFDKKELALQIQGHPSHPSIYIITRALNDFNINKLAIEVYGKTLEHQYPSCIENGISFTPAITINGYSIPSAYNRKNLIHFIEALNKPSIKRTTVPLISKLQKAI